MLTNDVVSFEQREEGGGGGGAWVFIILRQININLKFWTKC